MRFLILTFATAAFSGQLSLAAQTGCIDFCLCDSVSGLVRKLRKISDSVPVHLDGKKEEDDEFLEVIATVTLNQLRRDYFIRPAGIIVICNRMDGSTIPTLHKKKRAQENMIFQSSQVMRRSQVSGHVSVLVAQCGELVRIESSDILSTVVAADFSHNKITYVDKDIILNSPNLKILNLQHNLLTTVFYSIDENPLFQVNTPILLLEGNPLLCSCGLIVPVMQLIGKDEPACQLGKDRKSIVRNLIKDNSSNGSENLDALQDGSFEEIPLKFFELTEISTFCQKSDASISAFLDRHRYDFKRFRENLEYYEEIDSRLRFRTKNTYAVDYPLLICMTGWFIMVYVGILKFIRHNTIDYERHKSYLSKLDEQENSMIKSPQKRCTKDIMSELIGKKHSKLTRKSNYKHYQGRIETKDVQTTES